MGKPASIEKKKEKQNKQKYRNNLKHKTNQNELSCDFLRQLAIGFAKNKEMQYM